MERPRIGELLPQARRPVGVRRKLITYSLDMDHEVGGPKAQGFALILGITIDAVDYLEEEIRTGILETPVCAVRLNPPHGVNCVVDLPLRGLGDKRRRMVILRTAWILSNPTGSPRLTSAYIKS